VDPVDPDSDLEHCPLVRGMNPEPDPGGPKICGSGGSGFGSGSGTLLFSRIDGSEIIMISDTTFHNSLDPDPIFHIIPDYYLTLETIPDLDPTC
jgi:hypothetical protein